MALVYAAAGPPSPPLSINLRGCQRRSRQERGDGSGGIEGPRPWGWTCGRVPNPSGPSLVLTHLKGTVRGGQEAETPPLLLGGIEVPIPSHVLAEQGMLRRLGRGWNIPAALSSGFNGT